MKDQHTMIKGYRDLTEEEINMMNAIKEEGERLREMIATLRTIECVDQKLVDRAEADLQVGIMLLVRSVARPNSF